MPPEDRDAVLLFMALGTQWRWGPAGAVGLDYAVVEPTARLIGVAMTPDLFGDLRVMETEALSHSIKRTRP